ncbi:hypothetical protein C8R44DRAFT_753536 [Mycena epipterygia]|nr:hypothetical protein C8R44DRAFT_753536 [Mycena epipterygia]
MARIFSALFALCITVCAFAAPLHRRQTGDLQCNLARLKIISDVATTQTLIEQLNTTYVQTSVRSVLGLTAELSELSTATAVAVAQAGLNSVDEGIQAILTAIFNNQTAPASSRDQVGMGLAAAQTALGTITDPSANATITEALATLASAVTDGNNVVSDCK